jgi:hypothetical protein
MSDPHDGRVVLAAVAEALSAEPGRLEQSAIFR